MPTRLPNDNRTRARAHAVESSRLLNWLGVWAVSMGFAAIVLAAVAYGTVGDNIGASYILMGAAALVAIVLRIAADHSS